MITSNMATRHWPRLKPSLLVTFTLVSFLVTSIVAGALALSIERQLERLALQQEAEIAGDQVALVLNPNLNAKDLAGPLDPVRYAQIDALIRSTILYNHIVRIKIWNRDGLLIYSEEKELVGRQFPIDSTLQEALDGGITVNVSTLEQAENEFEKGRFGPRLLEVYTPLRPYDSTEILGSYEFYSDMTDLERRITEMRYFVWGRVILGFAILYGVLFTLVRGASRELIRRNQENARLYEETKQRLAERKQAEEALLRSEKMLERRVEERTHEIQRQRQVAEGLRDILTVLNSKRALDEILDYIVDQAGQLLGMAAGAIYLQGEDGLLQISASRGVDPQVVGLKIPPGVLPMGEAALKRQPVAVFDASPAMLELPGAGFVLSAPERAALESMFKRYPAWLAVPLVVRDEACGAIALFYYEPQEFSDETIRLITAFGNQAALAIENARLFAEVKDKAALEERQRLARDLHDSVSQSLYSLTLLSEAGRRLNEAGDAKRAGHYLTRLGETALQALKEMRLLVYELRPSALKTDGLAEALRRRLDAVEKRAGMKASIILKGVCDLPLPVETELFRIAHEALNNTLKHAMATEVMVALSTENGQAELEVADNGRGFDPEALSDTGGLGLISMRERAERLGGSLRIVARPGEGTRIKATIGL
jgi:two-component system nitrate/nitrite sensor histidine kinase NarX